MPISEHEFLKLADADIKYIVNKYKKNLTGVIIPNGTRRLLDSSEKLDPKTNDYKKRYIDLVSNHGLQILELFFRHNIIHSVFPIISDISIQRSLSYRSILSKLLLDVFSGPQFLRLYKKFNVSINIYGDIELIKDAGLYQAYDNIIETVKKTENHTDKHIFFGIGASDTIGADLLEKSSRFILEKNRTPTLSEQKKIYYSREVNNADFLISFCSFKAHGMPPLICNRNTQQYYIPAPSVISFNKFIFRKILYDLIFRRNPLHQSKELICKCDLDMFKEYQKRREWIVGLGDRVGEHWIMKEIEV
ncbi:MAG: hypothetical protein D3910_05065 [Candidatus Electrothrix sp. ATG2]|nr:hypothetical protein [Candidatus Electrothrix sp. ATG2]